MVVSARSKARQVLFDEAVADGGVNDNNPGMHPGHELSDLRNVARQPAAEAVLHYTRQAQISSFPQDPRSASNGHAAAPLMDASVEMPAATRPHRGKLGVTAACIGSFIFHSALAIALIVGVVVTPEQPEEEAGETVSVIMLGDSDLDQASSGEETAEPQPEEIVAEQVQPEVAQQPTEVQPDAQPVDPQPVAPTQEVTRVSPENMTAVEPEVLTSQVPAETSVVQPMATEVPTEVQPEVTETPPATPEDVAPVQPTETAEIPPEPETVPTPDPKPVAQKPVEKPKPVEKKQPPKKVVTRSGSQGENKQDSRRGASDGVDQASDQDSRSAGNRGGSGSAAVANYPGKVQSKIRRSVRVPSEYRRMNAAMSVRIRLSINGSGGVSSLSVARSSGIPELDAAVVDGVRRAAPFPPLPAEWGKPIWTFTQEVQVTTGR
ncbi:MULTISPECIES: energy transducer TonB family protein [unclassified Rhizobium]|uniref:energy transducer TonB family protein n=1 Tax=unclassified Rhizobium TaxID=2613769 RepID=UPI001ADC0F7E|nr:MULTISPECIES: energy transducer TonB [unclassified Rhizobium]MBO9125223.1 TonB family protein [Rhizobium sp. 16-488-2b]MBO9175808.1 TonB family protein [Rhizobium sp. 16-488-2a]